MFFLKFWQTRRFSDYGSDCNCSKVCVRGEFSKNGKRLKTKKIFFSVIKGAQDLEAFTENAQKHSDLQAVYIKSLEWMSAMNNLGHLKV